MDWYFYVAVAAILSELLFLYYVFRNYRYAIQKYRKHRSYSPCTVLIVPCKGVDSDFEKNIASFFSQDYENFLLWFVLADSSDPAYEKLNLLKSRLSQSTKAKDVRILISGNAQSSGQKVHNLLYCYHQLPPNVEVMAFADSDACIQPNWLSHIVYPLRNYRYGAAGGYRWFVPKKNNLASLALSSINAKVAQLLGKSPFNQAWGGSMAIRVDTFRKIGLDKIWQTAASDDLSLTCAVKKDKLRLAFVPACLVASYESCSWPQLFEFARRQFLITRVYAPAVWSFALFGTLYSILGLWAGLALAIYAYVSSANHFALYAAVPATFLASQILRAVLRQSMISKLLKEDWPKLKPAAAADILASGLWTILLFFLIVSSAFGRTIVWRGIKYRLQGPADTVVLRQKE